MKTYWGMEVYFPSFFDLGTRWKWVVSFTPQPLYPQGKSPLYPLDRRLSGPQSRSGHVVITTMIWVFSDKISVFVICTVNTVLEGCSLCVLSPLTYSINRFPQYMASLDNKSSHLLCIVFTISDSFCCHIDTIWRLCVQKYCNIIHVYANRIHKQRLAYFVHGIV
jgi:hypothetical protein